MKKKSEEHRQLAHESQLKENQVISFSLFLPFSIFYYTPAAAAINQIENKRLLGINEKKSLFLFSLISMYLLCVFFQLKIKFVFSPTLYGLFCSSALHSGCTHFGVVIRRTIDYISSCSNSCTANQLVAVAEREWFKSKCADPSVLPHVPHRPIRPGCASNGTERPLPTTPKSLYLSFIIFLLYRFLTLVIYIWCI